ncbi:hypothetical protein HY312_02870, partial [Candidatus Saccharibacteria bacterium]|nr:hypothetical protein [Candidatus Saccharibacteria bacterium]
MPRHERDTQVPSSTNNESYQSDRPSHPDHITAMDYSNTSLQEAVEKGWVDPNDIPDVVPNLRGQAARFRENASDLPSQQPTQEIQAQPKKDEFWTFGKKLGATTFTTLAVAGGIFGIKAMSDTPEPKNPTQETSLSIDGQDQGILDQQAVPIPETVELTQTELEAASSEYFTTLDTAIRINSYGPKLEEWRDGAYENLLPHLSESEKNLVSNEFPSLKTNYSD